MAGPIPLLNFDFGNPMDAALRAAMSTYGGITSGQANKTQNQLNKAKLPYAEKQEQERLKQLALANELSQYGIRQAEAELPYYGPQAEAELQKKQYEAAKSKAINDYLQQMLAGGQQSSGMSDAAGQPDSSGGNDTGFGNDMADQMFRQLIGMPAETPNEKSMRELNMYGQKETIKKGVEKNAGTSSFITQNQAMNLGIENTIPLLDDLMDMDVPGQLISGYFSPNDQRQYDNMVTILADNIVAARNWPKTDRSFEEAAKLVQFGRMETKEGYNKRLKNLRNELSAVQERVQGNAPIISKTSERSTAASNFEEEALSRGFKQVNGKWVKG
jgi:hypothetical protein